MNRFLLFVLCFINVRLATANRIDDLRTDHDVQTFVRKFDKRFRRHELEIIPTDSLRLKSGCNSLAGKLQVKSWQKLDLNQDGKTDLLVNAYWNNLNVFAIIDKGNNSFQVLQLIGNELFGCELARPIQIYEQTMIEFYSNRSEVGKNLLDVTTQARIDTLIYKFRGFVEYNPIPAQYSVDSIHMETSMCFGTCPVFKLGIASDGTATYQAIQFNPEQGNFKGKIDASKLQELLGLINYMNIVKLRDNYKVNWTDDQTVWLTIKFKDGSVKRITDYGMRGSFGLSYLYKLISMLRESQTWDE